MHIADVCRLIVVHLFVFIGMTDTNIYRLIVYSVEPLLTATPLYAWTLRYQPLLFDHFKGNIVVLGFIWILSLIFIISLLHHE